MVQKKKSKKENRSKNDRPKKNSPMVQVSNGPVHASFYAITYLVALFFRSEDTL